jgi:two-component system, OmpR family, sensor kinase
VRSPGAPSRIERARLRLPIRVKLAAVSAALTFVILCLFAVVIGAVAEQRIRAGFDDDLRATAADLVEQLDPETLLRGDVEEALGTAQVGGAQVRVLRGDGQVVYPEGAGVLLPPGLSGVVDAGDYRAVSRPLVTADLERRGLLDPLPVPVARAVGYVQYAKPEIRLERTVNRVRVFLALGVAGGTLLAFIGGLFVARRAMRPIAGLTRAAREVARTRDPDIRLPKPEANDEVSDLARTLETMLRELGVARTETETSLARQRKFVADASHELRTPLTSILANLELLETELQGEEREMASSALRSSRRMRRMVADLLLLARADSGVHAVPRPVDLADVAREAATEAAATADGHPLSLDVPDPVPVAGVSDELHRMVANLVENALVHTPSGTPITVSVRRNAAEAVLEVADRGPGVPPELRDRIFDRFARGAGDGSVGGSGLGLAIVRAVAQSHGGRVRLDDADGGGARFTVTLPLAIDGVPAADDEDQTSTTTGSTMGRRRSRS